MPIFETRNVDVRQEHHTKCETRREIIVQVIDEYGMGIVLSPRPTYTYPLNHPGPHQDHSTGTQPGTTASPAALEKTT